MDFPVNNQILKYCLLLILLLASLTVVAQRQSNTIQLTHKNIASHPIHITEWSKNKQDKKNTQPQKTLLLLSGPTDNWNSDSAWFARLAPKLAHEYRVISIDRAGQVLATQDAPVGYAHFGTDISQIIETLKLNNLTIIAFASANVALHHYFAQLSPADKTQTPISKIIMIDPDVLTEFSIKRYTKDAYPFKKNEEAYLQYIKDGKYNQRAQEKNDIELKHLKTLAGKDSDTDWEYLNKIFEKRLKQANLQNLFKEIAIYDQDLSSASKIKLPNNIPLTIIDTDFETTYIEQSDNADLKSELIKWQEDAAQYYQNLVKHAKSGQYISLPTQEHLLPFSDPELLINLINK